MTTSIFIIAIVYLVGCAVSYNYAVSEWRKFHERLDEKYQLGRALELELPWGLIWATAAISWLGVGVVFISFPPWSR